MVVDSIHLPRPRTTTVIKYERLQGLSELRIKLGERFGQRALAHTRRAGKNDQTSLSFIGHVRIPSSRAPLLFLGPLPLGRHSVQGLALGDPLQFAEGITRASARAAV